MSGLKHWSPVKGQNSVPEVDDKFQEIMAAVRCHADEAGFFDPGHEPSFASGNSFTVEGDKRAVFRVGQRIRLSDDGVSKYGVITGAEFLALTTVTVSLDDGLLITANLTTVAIGIDPRAVEIPKVPLATETTAGIVTLASDEDITNGTEDKVVDAAQLKAVVDLITQNPSLVKVFETEQLTFSNADTLSVSHTLGYIPDLCQFEFVCVAADNGFNPGDVIKQNSACITLTGDKRYYGATLAVNANTFRLRVPSRGVLISTLVSTGTLPLIPENWRVVIKAFHATVPA
ncbi:hypothetical protein [Kiloniella sp. b19]|uniref:hypothetical protein n=1 Tax=Kiloniella sp. GXU_MW_B19 TaxID=3141326 RepID=UPI0031DDF71F